MVHISATAKNAADDKIRQSLRRFADTHPPDTRIILVSGGSVFSMDTKELNASNKSFFISILLARYVEVTGKKIRELFYNVKS